MAAIEAIRERLRDLGYRHGEIEAHDAGPGLVKIYDPQCTPDDPICGATALLEALSGLDEDHTHEELWDAIASAEIAD